MSDSESQENGREHPFDLYGELEDAYDEADRDGSLPVVETLDAFGLWDGLPGEGAAFACTLRNALRGDAEAQAEVGRRFYWPDARADGRDERLDRPKLALFWHKAAAESGHGGAQHILGRAYCPDLDPHSEFDNGRFARFWLEQAAARDVPGAMADFARCLRCGKCGLKRDVAQAESIEAELIRQMASGGEIRPVERTRVNDGGLKYGK